MCENATRKSESIRGGLGACDEAAEVEGGAREKYAELVGLAYPRWRVTRGEDRRAASVHGLRHVKSVHGVQEVVSLIFVGKREESSHFGFHNRAYPD